MSGGQSATDYMLRANQIGIALMHAESPLIAMELYSLLIGIRATPCGAPLWVAAGRF